MRLEERSKPGNEPAGAGRASFAAALLMSIALAFLIAGCVYPLHYQDWQWQRWNPNYVPLPGDQH